MTDHLTLCSEERIRELLAAEARLKAAEARVKELEGSTKLSAFIALEQRITRRYEAQLKLADAFSHALDEFLTNPAEKYAKSFVLCEAANAYRAARSTDAKGEHASTDGREP